MTPIDTTKAVKEVAASQLEAAFTAIINLRSTLMMLELGDTDEDRLLTAIKDQLVGLRRAMEKNHAFPSLRTPRDFRPYWEHPHDE